ncbi:MAG: hypothetical protein ACOYN0_19225, partial [Phycisphaerales bacterium]
MNTPLIVSCKRFACGKHAWAQSEDAMAASADLKRFAVADGVSQRVCLQKQFAMFLAENFAFGTRFAGPIAKESVPAWEESLSEGWAKMLESWKSSDDARTDLNEDLAAWLTKPAAATFAGVELRPGTSDSGIWLSAVSVGDSYVFVVDQGRLIHALGTRTPEGAPTNTAVARARPGANPSLSFTE